MRFEVVCRNCGNIKHSDREDVICEVCESSDIVISRLNVLKVPENYPEDILKVGVILNVNRKKI